MSAKSLLVVALMAGAAVAQSSITNLTMSPADIAAHDPIEKAQWCTSQQSVCTALCTADSVLKNTCDPTTLNYTCTCTNGTAPGLQYYQNTIIFYECEFEFAACTNASQNNGPATAACTTDIADKCPQLSSVNITVPSSASSSSSSSSTPSATVPPSTASPASTSPPASTSKSAASVVNAQVGSGIFGLGMLMFGMLL